MPPKRGWTVACVCCLLSAVRLGLAQPNQDLIWSRTYGDTGNDAIYDLIITRDGGLAMVGTYQYTFTTLSSGGLLLRTDAEGDTIWSRKMGGNSTGNFLHGIAEDWNGSFVVAGRMWHARWDDRSYSIFIEKDSSNGQQIWGYHYGQAGWDDRAYAVALDSVRGHRYYVIAGASDSPTLRHELWTDMLLFRLQPSGQLYYHHAFYHGGDEDFSLGLDVEVTPSGDYVLAGLSADWYTHDDVGALFAGATGYNGLPLWQTFHRSGDETVATSIECVPDGGYLAAGCMYPYDASGDCYVMRLDTAGVVLWTHRYGGALDDEVADLEPTHDSCYVIAGYTALPDSTLDAYVAKIDIHGELLWERTYGGAGDEVAWAVQQAEDGAYILGGYTTSFGSGGQDCWYLKIDPEHALGTRDTGASPPTSFLVAVHPNPFNATTVLHYDLPAAGVVTITLSNLLGQTVRRLILEQQAAGVHELAIDGAGLSSGIYFLHLHAGVHTATRKLMLVR